MKLIHQIKLNVFIKENDALSIQDKFLDFIPLDFEKEKITINKDTATGFEDKKIQIINITLTKQKHIKVFIKNLLSKLTTEQITLLKNQIDSRLDDENNFFIRIDKEKIMQDKYIITDSGNCIHIKITIAAFPKTKENAKQAVLEVLHQKV